MNTLALSGPQLSLIRKTVASDCDDKEFDLFIQVAKGFSLDPFRKQVMPLVFSKNDPKKRRMSIVVSRDGLRTIAQRCGDYRPASEPAEITFDQSLISPTNPKGIVSARVRLWKQDKAGQWFPVMGEAYWDEFAPVADEWAENPETGQRGRTGKKVLDATGNWFRMPIIMITKCAESQALRAGWPDQFAGLYVEEEMDRASTLDATASEIVAIEAESRRIKSIGAADSITVFWGAQFALEQVPTGEFFDRVCEHIKSLSGIEVSKWADANRVGLKQFWAKHPGDALELKKRIEAASAIHDKPVVLDREPEIVQVMFAG